MWIGHHKEFLKNKDGLIHFSNQYNTMYDTDCFFDIDIDIDTMTSLS